MKLHSHSGAVPLVVLLYLGGAVLCTQLVPNWRPSHWFKKAPPTQQLQADQKALAAAQDELATLRAKEAQVKAEAEAQKLAQLRNAQQNVAGVAEALSRVPAQSKGPEVILAQDLNHRALVGLGMAIGNLPMDQQKEIEAIVLGALSKVQAERDQALAQLQQKEFELKMATAERQKAEAAIPPLQAKAATLEAVVAKDQAEVLKKTAEVVQWSDAKVQEERKAGSLSALVSSLERWLIIAGLIYLFVHFLLPSLAQEFPAVRILQKAYRFATSITSSHALQPQGPTAIQLPTSTHP